MEKLKLLNERPIPIRLHLQAGRPLADCEVALEAAGGDYDAALHLLRSLPPLTLEELNDELHRVLTVEQLRGDRPHQPGNV